MFLFLFPLNLGFSYLTHALLDNSISKWLFVLAKNPNDWGKIH